MILVNIRNKNVTWTLRNFLRYYYEKSSYLIIFCITLKYIYLHHYLNLHRIPSEMMQSVLQNRGPLPINPILGIWCMFMSGALNHHPRQRNSGKIICLTYGQWKHIHDGQNIIANTTALETLLFIYFILRNPQQTWCLQK